MKSLSFIQPRGQITFPEFAGERVYMRPFTKKGGLPSDLKRWQSTVDQMLEGVDAPGAIYLMIDQRTVQPGAYHRRPGLHIDGYWNPAVRAHNGRDDGGGSHGGRGGGGHITAGWDTGGGWMRCDFSMPEAIILASDVTASRGFKGVWDGDCKDGGDCAHIDTSNMEEVIFSAGQAYAGNVTMLHESLAIPFKADRTLVRLNVPGWTPEKRLTKTMEI